MSLWNHKVNILQNHKALFLFKIKQSNSSYWYITHYAVWNIARNFTTSWKASITYITKYTFPLMDTLAATHGNLICRLDEVRESN